jgi:hypothetical protein
VCVRVRAFPPLTDYHNNNKNFLFIVITIVERERCYLTIKLIIIGLVPCDNLDDY